MSIYKLRYRDNLMAHTDFIEASDDRTAQQVAEAYIATIETGPGVAIRFIGIEPFVVADESILKVEPPPKPEPPTLDKAPFGKSLGDHVAEALKS